MSYLSINIDNLSNMISEYNNLIEALKGCGDILSQSIGSLSEFEFSGVDAEILREAWGAETYDKIPTIREVLESVKSALEDSLEEYKNCKKYNEEFIVAFDGYGDVCFSAEDMSGNVKCDTSMLADSSSYCAEIGDIKLDIATSIVSAKNMMAGLNKFQTAISQEIEDFSNLNSKLNQFSLHQFTLSKYSGMMTEADDNLYNKLNAKGLSFTSLYINDGYVPPAVKLMGYSPEVLRVATILAKKNPTADDYLFLSHVFAKEETLSREDYELMMKVIGETVVVSDDEPWNDLQSQVMALSYKYAVNAEDTELLTMFFGYVAVKESDKNSVVHFDNPKMYGVLKYIDPHEDGMAYFTAMCSTHIPTEQLGVCAHIGVELVDGNLRLVYSPSGYQSAQYIDFIDMFETIPDGAYENMHDSWGMDDDEIVDFLSCFYSVEDIDKICELSCLEHGNEEQYNEFFAGGTRGITSAFYPALADYTYHLGEYGTEEYLTNLTYFENSIWDSGSKYFYIDAIGKGFHTRFLDAYNDTIKDFNSQNFINYCHYSTLETLFKSELFAYEKCADTLGGVDIQIVDLKYLNDLDLGYTFQYDYDSDNPDEGIYLHEKLDITVYGYMYDDIYDDGKLIDDVTALKFDKEIFGAKVCYEYARMGMGFIPAAAEGLDYIEKWPKLEKDIPIVIDDERTITYTTSDVSSVASKSYELLKEYMSFDTQLQAKYDDFFGDKMGWRSGFRINNKYGSNDIDDIFKANESTFICISEAYSPQGLILQEEIYDGFYTKDLSDDDREYLNEMIEATSFYYNDEDEPSEELKEAVKLVLFGGFDRAEFLKENGNDQYKIPEVYFQAENIYSITFKGDDLLEEKGEKRQEEIIMEKLGL